MSQNSSSRESISFPRLADLVIRARAIYSMAEERTIFRAIAIGEEWIVAVSEDPHGPDGLITSGTHVVDDPELTLLPAFDALPHENLPFLSSSMYLPTALLLSILQDLQR
jgi:hypothetical protein